MQFFPGFSLFAPHYKSWMGSLLWEQGLHRGGALCQGTPSVSLDSFPRSHENIKIPMMLTDPAGHEIRPRSKGLVPAKRTSHTCASSCSWLHPPPSQDQSGLKASYNNNWQPLVLLSSPSKAIWKSCSSRSEPKQCLGCSWRPAKVEPQVFSQLLHPGLHASPEEE